MGKSTLFNALTKKGAEASNYPFCTIEPNVGVVKVPDQRLYRLAEISKPKKIIPAVVEFVDIAGLVKDAHKGEGLGNQFLANIRECNAICEVVRDFEDTNIIHVNGNINPDADQETINMELIFADLQTVEKRLERASKDAKSGDKKILKEKTVLENLKKHLDEGNAARTMALEQDDLPFIKSLNLLTIKPIIYVLNKRDCGQKTSKDWDGEVICLNVKQEEEIANLPEEEQAEYIKELGFEQSGLDKLISASYALLDLITYFTTGPDETRAWTIKRGTKAPHAAGEIHTDFERGFVRAEVINWKTFLEMGSEATAKEKGLMRIEGKDYVMQDGDVCNFLINK